jgi:hypothetical protein
MVISVWLVRQLEALAEGEGVAVALGVAVLAGTGVEVVLVEAF